MNMEETKDFLSLCEIGGTQKVKNYLKKSQNFDIDVSDNDGNTGLQVSAANGHVELTHLLLKHNANSNKCNGSGWGPLHHASFHGHKEVCEVLLKFPTTIDQRNKFGATSLNIAAASGHTSIVKLLLSHGALVDEENIAQYANCPTPFLTASLYCRESIMKLFLERKPYLINASTSESFWTPLMFTSAAGSKPTTQFLVDQGADPDRLNALDQTALDIASECSYHEVKTYLEARTRVKSQSVTLDRKKNFFDAVRDGNLDKVAEFLSHEIVDIDTVDDIGASALMVASMMGHLDVVKLVVSLGADLNKQDYVNGWTALMQSIFYGHKGVSAFLIERGSDPTVTAFNGCTVLDLATLMEDTDTDMLRMLATYAIEFAPPSMILNPSKKKKKRLTKRSISTPLLYRQKDEGHHDNGLTHGFRSWLSKISRRFRRLKQDKKLNGVIAGEAGPEPEDGMNIHQVTLDDVESTLDDVESFRDPTSAQDEKNSVGGIQAALFTLGFSAATTDLSSYTLSPLDLPGNTSGHRSKNSVSANFSMPEGLVRSYRDQVMPAHPFLRSADKRKNRRLKKKSFHKKERTVWDILSGLKLEQYIILFQEQEIDLEAFKHLSDSDLGDLGVTNPTERKLLLEASKSLLN